MLMRSISAASTSAVAQARARSRMRAARSSRTFSEMSLESRRPRMGRLGSRMTAAATTGPKSEPRPASSTPATERAPVAQALRSKLRVQRSFFKKRSFLAAGEREAAASWGRAGAKATRCNARAQCRPIPGILQRKLLFGVLGLAQAGGLALEIAQVEQAGAAHARGTHHLHLVDDLGVQGEDALHALSEAHLAHGEAAMGAAAAGDDGAFEGLQALFLAFLDAHVHADGVARGELRQVGALQLGCDLCHDGVLRHCGSSRSRFFPAGARPAGSGLLR